MRRTLASDVRELRRIWRRWWDDVCQAARDGWPIGAATAASLGVIYLNALAHTS